MLFKSQVYTQASGSIGGTTYAHNSAGMYTRGRGLPTNPNTAAQQDARANLQSLASRWSQVLTQVQRDAWATYAANSPITGRLGDPLTLSGQQMYVRCNAPRLRAGMTVVDAGPVIFGMDTFSPVTAIGQDGSSDLEVTFTAGDDWAGEVGGALIVQSSRPMSQAINFFKGPFQFAGVILGAVAPPTSPATLVAPFGVVYGTDQRVVSRIISVRADGRLGPAQIYSALTA